MQKKVVFIVGPTGVGKTALAFDLTSQLNGSLISADSVQVFKGLDIISGKDLPKDYIYHAGYYSRVGCPSIYLLDVIDPKKSFSVSNFYTSALKAISEIFDAGNTPIVVGGTGLYVQSLLNGFIPSSKPDNKLRNKLSNLSVEELQNLIPKDDLSKFNASDRMNKRRLIRKIEYLKSQKKIIKPELQTDFTSLVIGLECDRDLLRKRIDQRVEDRLREGAIDEAKKLFKGYVSLTEQVKNANGYKQLFAYLKEEMSFDEAIYRWKISEYRHAKNQMTWFRKYGGVEWHDIGKLNIKKKILDRVENFLKE